MPGNTNQPDHSDPHSVPQSTFDTSGEFTQIFAAGAVPPSPTAGEQQPIASADDEFAKMFLSPAAPVEAPAKQRPRTADNEATLIFEAIPSAPATPRTVPVEPLPPIQPKQAVAMAPSAPRAFAPPSSEFTQIFSPIAPPVAPPPDVKAAAKPSAPSSGEFTQFFSAISARENASTPAAPRAAPQAQSSSSAATDRRDLPAKPIDDFDRMFAQSPHVPAVPHSHGEEHSSSVAPIAAVANAQSRADAQTQVFQAQPLPPEPSDRRSSAASNSDGGSFTHVFQQIAPPNARSGSAAMSPVPVQPASPQAPMSAQPSATAGVASAWPAFGPPPQPSGTFTDVFAAQPASGVNSWPAAPPAAAPVPQGEGFTELFQAMPATAQPQPPASPFSSPGMSLPGAGAAPWPSSSQAPLPHAAPLSAGGGDFTRLMQSLSPSAQGSAQAPAQNDAFFAASSGMGSGAHQESEFTRVQRASARRELGGAAAAQTTPVPGAAVAPGLAMAPPKAEKAEKEAPTKKSKTLVILLVAMNILLLLVLIVIAFLVLRRK